MYLYKLQKKISENRENFVGRNMSTVLLLMSCALKSHVWLAIEQHHRQPRKLLQAADQFGLWAAVDDVKCCILKILNRHYSVFCTV